MKHKLKTSILLSTFAIGVLHILNRFIHAAATVKNLLSREKGSFFHWRFGNIYYTKTGEGTPLLLIHNLSPDSSSYEWCELIGKLSKDHTVYALDLLGCGRSDKPNLTYTNFLYVQLVTDFVKQVIGQKTDVAATGLSSSFVIMACHNDPELFHKILMINPISLKKLNSIPGKRSKTIKFLMDLPIIGTTVYHMNLNQSNVEYSFTENYLYNPFRLKQKYVHVYHESAHLGDEGGKYLLASISGFYVNVNISHALSEINNSIIMICGKRCEDCDTVLEEYVSVNPAIETAMVEDTKLLPQLESPDALYAHMQVFL